jgi:hypothetical protein
MDDFHKDLLLEIITEYDDEQLKNYIFLQEMRLENARRLIVELKELQRRRKKKKQKPVDTGARDGR